MLYFWNDYNLTESSKSPASIANIRLNKPRNSYSVMSKQQNGSHISVLLLFCICPIVLHNYNVSSSLQICKMFMI